MSLERSVVSKIQLASSRKIQCLTYSLLNARRETKFGTFSARLKFNFEYKILFYKFDTVPILTAWLIEQHSTELS